MLNEKTLGRTFKSFKRAKILSIGIKFEQSLLRNNRKGSYDVGLPKVS